MTEYVEPLPGEFSDHDWTCAMCGGVTRHSYVVATGYMTDLCQECRGYITITPAEAQAEIDARTRAWAEGA